MIALLILALCAVALAADKKGVCCSQLDLENNRICISNVPAAQCTPNNALSDPKHANCCKTKAFSCDQYFILVGSVPVASTCAHDKVDTDTTTDD